MSLGELAFDFANLLTLFGTIMLIRQIVKGRKALNGISGLGSFLTLVGMISVTVAYVDFKLYVALALSIPTTFLWLLASIFTLKQRLSMSG